MILLALVGLQYLWNPLEPSAHVWAMRRFVPVVLPLLMLVVSMGVAACLDRVAPLLRVGRRRPPASSWYLS